MVDVVWVANTETRPALVSFQVQLVTCCRFLLYLVSLLPAYGTICRQLRRREYREGGRKPFMTGMRSSE